MEPRPPAEPETATDDDAPYPVDLRQRLAFLEVTDEDARRLRSLRDSFLAYAQDFVEDFYRHLLAFEETASFLSDPELVQRLKKSQLAHFESMLAAQWDDQFVQQRRQVGEVHARNGIEPQFFLAAYNQFMQYALRELAQEEAVEDKEFAEQVRSLVKGVFLDIGLTLDAYLARETLELRRALDMYWRANNELRQFAELASHDLKTPLATVANLCEEVLDEFAGQMPEEAGVLIDKARQRAFGMGELIDKLLVSATSSRDVDADHEIPSEAVVHEALDRLRLELEARDIRITLPSRWPYVKAQRTLLGEVFYNLFSNAIKFIDQEHGEIEVAVRTVEDNVIFTVCDNGSGIRPEELERIFSPFHRLREHRKIPGNGLGLYFTKNLMEQQGGRVWAESSEGEGSTFFVSLRRGASAHDGVESSGR